MALRAEYSLVHSEFNDFLFAFVGEEKNGIQLTVLSALARLGFDPWGEAARLSELTREAATTALAATIATLPAGDWKASDSRSVAGRLIAHLPEHVSPPARSSQDRSIRGQKSRSETRKWLIWIAIATAALIVMSRLYGS